MDKKTGFVDVEKLELEADVMSNAGGKPTTWYCTRTCPTSNFVYTKPYTYVCGACVSKVLCVSISPVDPGPAER